MNMQLTGSRGGLMKPVLTCGLVWLAASQVTYATVIYRETFGNASGSAAAFSSVGWQWVIGNSNGTANIGTTLTGGIYNIASTSGSPINLDNINAGSSASQEKGYISRSANGAFAYPYRRVAGWTEEYSVDRDAWNVDSINFYMSASATSGIFQVLLRIHPDVGSDQWVVSDQQFSVPSGSLNTWLQKTLDFTTADWRSIGFVPPTTDGTGSFPAPGALLSNLPAGDITAFGFFSPPNNSKDAILRMDTYEINVSPVPEPGTFAMLLFGSVMLWVVGKKRR